jgi:hypothetical protein
MARFSELHLRLEELSQKFLKDQSEENSALLIAEFTRLILNDADVLIDGSQAAGAVKGQVIPSGYTGPDGRFYIHIFTSKIRFDDSDAKHPNLTKLKGLCQSVFDNEKLGGFSLNYKPGEGTILLSKEDIMDGLQAVIASRKKEES